MIEDCVQGNDAKVIRYLDLRCLKPDGQPTDASSSLILTNRSMEEYC